MIFFVIHLWLKLKNKKFKNKYTMYLTLELASKLEDAPWPATKDELNLDELEDELYECIEDVWPDYPTKEDFLWNEDEY